MTVNCPCGKPTRTRNTTGHRPPIDEAMNTYTRIRKCPCGKSIKTVELLATELGELRRLAYLAQRQGAT